MTVETKHGGLRCSWHYVKKPTQTSIYSVKRFSIVYGIKRYCVCQSVVNPPTPIGVQTSNLAQLIGFWG